MQEVATNLVEVQEIQEDASIDDSFRGRDLSGRDFSNMDLSGSDFSGANLSHVNFQRTNLLNANFSDAILIDANLKFANLSGANLKGAVMEKVRAHGASFGMADLSSASLFNATLAHASLIKTRLKGADLRCANLQGARLREADLEGADFTEANLKDADLSMSYVSRANFNNADLRGAKLRVLRGYKKASWIGTDLRNINFAGAHLLQRFAKDQNFLYEFKESGPWARVLYYLWLISSDCGRSMGRWCIWIVVQALFFAWLYSLVGMDYGAHPTSLSNLYVSVVTLTTLGFGDVIPSSIGGQIVVMCEVVTGYIMLGGLLSIFSNKMARRGE